MATRPKVKPTGAMIGGLPTYTRAQFQQVRPGGKYSSYLNYIKRARGITEGPKYPGRGGPGLPTYESLLRGMSMSFETPAQLQKRANQMAAQQMKFQQQMIQQEYARQRDDAMNRMRAFAAAGNQAAAMNASLIGQVGGEYTRGADALSQMAAAGAAQMDLATQGGVGAANAAAANVGMPGVTVGGPVGQPGVAGAAQAGVESYYGGTLPAQAMTNAGGYAQAGMAGLISSQNLRATQEAEAAYMQAMGTAQRDKADAMRELVMGRPTAAADALTKLQDAQRQQYALAMSLIAARRDALNRGFEQSITKKENVRAQGEHEAKMKAAQQALKAAQQAAKLQGRQIDMARSAALGYYVDMKGNPIKKGGKNIKVPVALQAGGGTKAANANTREKMADAADQWLYRHRNRQGQILGDANQLYRYLIALYPGNPKIARAIADSTFPPTTGKGGKGGTNPFTGG